MLGENIRYLRHKANMSQDDLADMMGYKSYTTIQKWESGVAEPPLKALKKLSDIFGVDMNTIATANLLIDTNMARPVDSHDIERFIAYYSQLNQYNRDKLIKLLGSLVDLQKQEEDFMKGGKNE